MNKVLNRIKSLTKKEFLNLWVDKRITAMLLFSPVIQLIIFAWAVTLEVKNVTMVIYDQDKTQYSNELIYRFNNKSIIKEILFVNSYQEIKNITALIVKYILSGIIIFHIVSAKNKFFIIGVKYLAGTK